MSFTKKRHEKKSIPENRKRWDALQPLYRSIIIIFEWDLLGLPVFNFSQLHVPHSYWCKSKITFWLYAANLRNPISTHMSIIREWTYQSRVVNDETGTQRLLLSMKFCHENVNRRRERLDLEGTIFLWYCTVIEKTKNGSGKQIYKPNEVVRLEEIKLRVDEIVLWVGSRCSNRVWAHH